MSVEHHTDWAVAGGSLADPNAAREQFKREWTKEQDALRKRLVVHDDIDFTADETGVHGLRYAAGVDISFHDNGVDACAGLVVLEYPSLKVVYEDMQPVKLLLPYIPGFLAFREIDHIIALLDKLRHERPDVFPQVLLVDGNGVLHHRGFGLACHLGVLANVPALGCAKTLLAVDGLHTEDVLRDFHSRETLSPMPLRGTSGREWGYAFAARGTKNPTFVSGGHRISNATAVALVNAVSPYRVAEPVRQADLRSRQYIRQNM